MPIKTIAHKPLHMNCHILRLLSFVGMLCAVFFFLPAITYADSTPGGNIADPTVRAVDIAKPAVVRIITELPSKLTVHFSKTNSVTFPQTSDSYPVELSGSGAFISSRGDILTADHVVNPPHDSSLSQYLDTLAAPDVTAYINSHGTQQVTKDQVTSALQNNQIASDPQYGSAVSEAFYSTAYTGPLTATNFQNVPSNIHAKVDTIEKESPTNQKDTAIVHVPLTDTPSVALGDSTTVQQQDELTIIGFPGNGDIGNNPNSVLSSSINKVLVSSLKTTDNGAPVIQVGGNVEHGDSGGPALDDKGNIVGVVSFGTADPNSPGSTSFLQASSSAKELIQSLNLDTTPGAFQKAWNQAFTDYSSTSAGHWHKAETGFAQIQSNYPNFKAVAPYLTYAQAQAKNETQPAGNPTNTPISIKNTTSIPALAWTIGALTLIAFLALLIVALGFGRRGKKNPAPVSVAQGYPIQAAPIQPRPQVQQQVNNNFVPPTANAPQAYNNGLAAFGGPPPAPVQPYPTVQQQPAQMPTVPAPQASSGQQASSVDASNALHPWPCGHLNRSSARFCSICGEPAPPPSTTSTFVRRIEQ